MTNGKITLFQFKIPEISNLPPEEQQPIVEWCWNSAPVQRAWKLYWSRPLQFPLIPIVPIAIYWVLTDRSPGTLLAIVLPIALLGSFLIRPYYKKRLIAAVKDASTSRVRTLCSIPEAERKAALTLEPVRTGPQPEFTFRQHKGKLIAMAICWLVIIVFMILRRHLPQ